MLCLGTYEHALCRCSDHNVDAIRPFSVQTLSSTGISHANGNTVMTFTRPLTPADTTKHSISTNGYTTVNWAHGG